MKICEQTNVAQVDNSAIECIQPISTNCIIHESAISYLGLQDNSSMTQVVENLLFSLIDARNRIELLEQRVTTLETP